MTGLTRIGVVGLGAMGLPMAETLAGKGFDVVGFDTDANRRGRFAATVDAVPALAAGCDATLLSLPNSAIVERVCATLFDTAGAGHVVLDTSTADPASTRALQAEAAARGIGFVDCPVSGGAAGAARGALLVMAGGVDADLDRSMPVLDALARRVVRCGGPGAGNVAKLINNLLCAAQLQLAGEALRLGDAAGITSDALVEVLNAGSGRSAVTEVNLPTWVMNEAFDSGFTMGLMRKDVRLAADLARAVSADLPLASIAARLWADSAARLDDGADFNRLAEAAWKDSGA